MMKRIKRYIPLALGFMLLTACNSQDEVLSSEDDSNIIHVGGVSTSDMVTTAVATRADVAIQTPNWLKDSLSAKGMTIYYYQDADAKQEAKLKLANDLYSLTNSNDKHAKWLGNGAHYFEGVFIPEDLEDSKTRNAVGARRRIDHRGACLI